MITILSLLRYFYYYYHYCYFLIKGLSTSAFLILVKGTTTNFRYFFLFCVIPTLFFTGKVAIHTPVNKGSNFETFIDIYSVLMKLFCL